MDIRLEGVGKKYVRRWIFQDLTYDIAQGARLGITGYNGSGKSTLLRIITGAMPPSSGTVHYEAGGQLIKDDRVFSHMMFASPYTDMVEEMSIAECLRFHASFRQMRPGIDLELLLQKLGSQFDRDAYIKTFSSGMKQRLKLAMAILTQTDVLILDEPTSNLDEQGKAWYQELLEEVDEATTLIIASNESSDMAICSQFIHIPDHSPSN